MAAVRSSCSHGRACRTIEKAAPPHVASVRRNLIDLLTPEEIDALAAISQKVVAHLSLQTALA